MRKVGNIFKRKEKYNDIVEYNTKYNTILGK